MLNGLVPCLTSGALPKPVLPVFYLISRLIPDDSLWDPLVSHRYKKFILVLRKIDLFSEIPTDLATPWRKTVKEYEQSADLELFKLSAQSTGIIV